MDATVGIWNEKANSNDGDGGGASNLADVASSWFRGGAPVLRGVAQHGQNTSDDGAHSGGEGRGSEAGWRRGWEEDES